MSARTSAEEKAGGAPARGTSTRMVVFGLAVTALGVAAAAAVFTMKSVGAEVSLLGSLILAAGAVSAAQAIVDRLGRRAWPAIYAGLLYVVVGVVMAIWPGMAVIVLTAMLAALFFTVGTFRVIIALSVRPRQWGWSLLWGITSLVLGSILMFRWPHPAVRLIGILIAVELVFCGVHLIGTGLGSSRWPRTPLRYVVRAPRLPHSRPRPPPAPPS